MSSSDFQPSKILRSTRAHRKLVYAAIALMLAVVAFAPTIIANSGFRDRLINAAIADKTLHASTQSASFGYLSPLSVQGFELLADDGSLNVEMQSFQSEKSWLMMLFAGGDLGTFRFREPILRIVTGIASSQHQTPNEPTERAPMTSLPTFVAEVRGGGVQVRNVSLKNPAIDLRGIDFTIRTEQQEFGTFVHVDPTTILDQQPLTPELCSSGLQLIAPMLADAVVAQGRLSFQIDRCSIPVGELSQQQRQELTDIGGVIRLADVSVGLNNEITATVLSLLERFGSSGHDVKLTVSRNSEVRFHVVGGRVHHQGLMFLLPMKESDFQLTSSGSVGFDETLDLKLTLGLPASLLGDGPLAKFLTSEPIVIQVAGSVDEPRIDLAASMDWNGRLSNLLETLSPGDPQNADTPGGNAQDSGDALMESAGAVLDAVGGWLNRDQGQERTRLRDLLEQRRLRGESETPERQRPGVLRRRPGR